VQRRHFLALPLLLTPGMLRAREPGLWEQSTLNQILKRGELRVGLEAGYMPFEMLDRNGNLIGFDIDLARKMASVMKVKVRFVNTQWDGIIPALLTDKFDLLMGGMTITPERNLQVNFTRPYIVIGQTALLAKKLEGKITKHTQLDDPKYIVTSKLGTSGDLAAKRFFPRAQLKRFESEADASLEVRNGPRGCLHLRLSVQRDLRVAVCRQRCASRRAVHERESGLGDPQGRPGLSQLARQFSRRDPQRRHLRSALQALVRKHGVDEES
jgi:hypothetical protein